MSTLFPLFLKLEGRPVLLVGGGRVAAAKLTSLQDARASVTVVAPEVLPEILRSAATVHVRPFRPADLDGVWFVVSAATPEVNREVARAASERRVFVNAVDDPEQATAYTGGVLRRGGVTLSISTAGQAPALAGLLREGLDAALPRDLDAWVETARIARPRWKASGVPLADRRPALLRLLNGIYERRGLAYPGAHPAAEALR
jgi:uroporphyrin-III C-methyltransferase / precorrin-2 dehydrogenase / sirohydrochlorin ferrochelatase